MLLASILLNIKVQFIPPCPFMHCMGIKDLNELNVKKRPFSQGMLQILTQDGHAPDKEAKNKAAIKREYILLFISEVF